MSSFFFNGEKKSFWLLIFFLSPFFVGCFLTEVIFFTDTMSLRMKQGPKKDGEKYNLLNICGQLLFGCMGRKQFTQGIYTRRSADDELMQCFCKRGVWVPESVSVRKLRKHFKDFHAILPSVVVNTVGRGNLGLCGRNPTRTLHATDTEFMLLARPTGQFYRVVALVTLKPCEEADGEVSFTLHGIASDSNSIAQCIEWVKNEARSHEKRVYKSQATHTLQALPVVGSPCVVSTKDYASEYETESDGSDVMSLRGCSQGDECIFNFQPLSKRQELCSPFSPVYLPDAFLQEDAFGSFYQNNIPIY